MPMLRKKVLRARRKAHSSPHLRPDNLKRSEWTADILQVHHRNHDPSQNQISNLQAVCAACHLNLHRGGAASKACKRR